MRTMLSRSLTPSEKNEYRGLRYIRSLPRTADEVEAIDVALRVREEQQALLDRLQACDKNAG